jgi:hypothetical protein
MIVKQAHSIPLYRGYFIILFTSEQNYDLSRNYDVIADNKICEFAQYHRVNHMRRQGFLVSFNTDHPASYINHGTIAHEVFHAAHGVLLSRGLELTDASDEAYAYLIDWMTDKVYELIKKHNIEITYVIITLFCTIYSKTYNLTYFCLCN